MSGRQLIVLALILTAGTLARGAYLAELTGAPDFRVPRLDAIYHDYWARGLAFGEWTPPAQLPAPRIGELPYFRPPGYAFFLSLVYKLTGGSYLASRAVQFALGLVNALLGFWFARRWYGTAAALVTAGAMAASWVLVYYEGEYLEPVLLVTLTWALLLALGEWRSRPRLAPALAAGALAGAFAVVRPNILLFIPVAAAWVLLSARATPGGLGARRIEALCLCLASALVVLPVTVRNWVVAHDLVLISSNSGVNLLMGQDREAIAYHASPLTGDWNCFDYPRLLAEASAKAGRTLKASEVSARYAREARRLMLADPLGTLRLLGYKALLFWGPREVSNNKVEELERRASRTLSALPVGFPLLLGAAVIGAAMEWRRRRAGAESPPAAERSSMSLLLCLFAFVYFLSFLPYVAAGQYRVPVLPVLAVFAGIAAAGLGSLASAGRRREAAAWGIALLAAWGGASVNLAGYEVQPWLWHMARADSAETAGDAALAEREYRAAIALAPQRANLHFGLGVVLAKAGRLEEGAGEFRRTLELDPSHAKASFNLGLALFWQGLLTESVPHFERALALKPDYAEARQRLATVNGLLGRPLKARRGPADGRP